MKYSISLFDLALALSCLVARKGHTMVIHTHKLLQLLAASLLKYYDLLLPPGIRRLPDLKPVFHLYKPDGCFLLTKYMKNTCRRMTFFKTQVDELKVDEWEEHVANVIKSSYDTLRSLKLLKRYPIQAKKNSRSIDIIEN